MAFSSNPDEIPPSEADFSRMEDRLLASVASARQHRRRRRLAVGSLAGAVVVLASAGFAWVVLASPQMRAGAAYCYASDTTSANYATIATIPVISSPPGAAPGTEEADAADVAIDKCAAVWRIGAIGRSTPPPNDGVTYPVPALEACLANDGVLAVFPYGGAETNRQFCERLSLGPTR